MGRTSYDASSKWLLEQHGRGVLWLGELRDVRSCQALAADIVQPRKLPDGLLQVRRASQRAPTRVLVEVATYPERRVVQQALDDLKLVSLHLGGVPDLMILVLRPKGTLEVPTSGEEASQLGWSKLAGTWKVVKLWEQSAEELLAAGYPGLLPWAPLTRFDGSAESLLQRCRDQIDRSVGLEERANLLAVTQVLTQLRFNDPRLLNILGGAKVMIESPLLRDLVAERRHADIVRVLRARFKEVPPETVALLNKVKKEEKLDGLVDAAAICASLEEFREKVLS